MFYRTARSHRHHACERDSGRPRKLASSVDGTNGSLAYGDYTGLTASSAAATGLTGAETQKTLLAA